MRLLTTLILTILISMTARSQGEIELQLISGDTFQQAEVDGVGRLRFNLILNDSSNTIEKLKWRITQRVDITDLTPNWLTFVVDETLGYGPDIYSKLITNDFLENDTVYFSFMIYTYTDTGTNKGCISFFDPNDSLNSVETICLTVRVPSPPLGLEENNGAITLKQNIPNPFSETTIIQYQINEQADLVIYDLVGRKVQEHNLSVGSENITVSGLNSGQYFYSLLINEQVVETRSLIVR